VAVTLFVFIICFVVWLGVNKFIREHLWGMGIGHDELTE
jgi:hypothetical protein